MFTNVTDNPDFDPLTPPACLALIHLFDSHLTSATITNITPLNKALTWGENNPNFALLTYSWKVYAHTYIIVHMQMTLIRGTLHAYRHTTHNQTPQNPTSSGEPQMCLSPQCLLSRPKIQAVCAHDGCIRSCLPRRGRGERYTWYRVDSAASLLSRRGYIVERMRGEVRLNVKTHWFDWLISNEWSETSNYLRN
jgi:hypothetical protein